MDDFQKERTADEQRQLCRRLLWKRHGRKPDYIVVSPTPRSVADEPRQTLREKLAARRAAERKAG